MACQTSSLKKYVIKSSLGICILITGCVPVSVNVTPQPIPTCISTASEANPYSSHPLSGAITIYDDYKKYTISLEEAKQKAFFQLGKNTEHWSDYVDVLISETQMVRITVTYMDPVLVQYIVLNHVLAYPVPNLEDSHTFNEELDIVMSTLAARNEMIFVVTITAPAYNEMAFNDSVLRLKIPIEQMSLISAADVKVIPTHEDHILDENMDITHGPLSGIVGYPLAVLVQGNCTWIIDTYTNMLTLDVPSVTLGSMKADSQFWSIPYRPLAPTGFNNPAPTYDPYFDWNRIQRSEEPPKPDRGPYTRINGADQQAYWEAMSRYLWNLIIMETHH